MDFNDRRAQARARARARFSAKWVEGTATAGDVAGAVAGGIESGYWWNQLPSRDRQSAVNTITESLTRRIPLSSQEGVLELQKIALQLEEKIYHTATSYKDYERKISLKMRAMEANSQYRMINDLHPYAASNGQNSYGQEMTTEATSYKTTSGPEESYEEQAVEEEDWDVPKEDVVEEVVVTKEQNYVVGHKENARVVENEISCGLSSDAKLDERRLAQVEERLEKMEAHSEKVETLLVDINEKLNYLMKMQDAKASRDIRRRAKHMSSSWTGNGRSKRKHRVADMIRQSCQYRRLGRGDKTVVTDQRKLDDEEQNI